MAAVLILDDDLGFVFWLGQALAADFKPIPAPSVQDARKLLRRLRIPVDVLIVNPLVPGAAYFTRDLRRKQGRLRAIAAVRYTEELDPMLQDLNAARSKPGILDHVAMSEWRQVVRQVLASKTRPRSRRATASDGGSA